MVCADIVKSGTAVCYHRPCLNLLSKWFIQYCATSITMTDSLVVTIASSSLIAK